jgi:predicted kinase
VARLILINGAPGVGKSTVAQALADGTPMALALDVDGLKHALGGWRDDLFASGTHARQLALALARTQLDAGHDVVMGQYLARTPFIEALEGTAHEHGARFHELVLDLDAESLAERLDERPRRPEHVLNDELVSPADGPTLVESIDRLRDVRPGAVWIDARGSAEETLQSVRDAASV